MAATVFSAGSPLGSGAEESVFTGDHDVFPKDISRDGKTILFDERADQKVSVWALPLGESGKPSQIIGNGENARFSPDEKYVAFDCTEAGTYQVYVVPFGERKGKWQVSSESGLPQWSRDGKELYYLELANGAYTIVTVAVNEQGDQLQFGSPQTLIRNINVANVPFFDVSPDGKRILLNRLSEQSKQSVTLVTNFTEELKK